MATNIIVTSKASSATLLTTTDPNIHVSEASIVHIAAHKGQLDKVEQVVNALVVTLKDGEVIIVDNFFDSTEGATANSLVFDGDKGFLLANSGNGLVVGDYLALDTLDPLYAHTTNASDTTVTAGSDIALTPWLMWAGLGAVTTGGLLAYWHHEHHKSDSHVIPTVNQSATLITASAAPQVATTHETTTETAGSGNNLLDAQSGINIFTAGSGHSTIIYDLLNSAGTVTPSTTDPLGGHSGLDVFNGFHLGASTDANADYIDITALLGSAANSSNISNYVNVSYNASSDTATVSIDRAGDGVAANYHNLIALHLDAAPTSGTLTLQDLMQNHQLLV